MDTKFAQALADIRAKRVVANTVDNRSFAT